MSKTVCVRGVQEKPGAGRKMVAQETQVGWGERSEPQQSRLAISVLEFFGVDLKGCRVATKERIESTNKLEKASIRSAFSLIAILSTVMLSAPASSEVIPASVSRVHHVVIVWLKEHGNAAARERYLEASRRLSKLPMVLRYQVGTVLAGGRDVVDSSYDVAVVATFESQQALHAYLDDPTHKEVIEQGLKPLVEKVVVYDFAETP